MLAASFMEYTYIPISGCGIIEDLRDHVGRSKYDLIKKMYDRLLDHCVFSHNTTWTPAYNRLITAIKDKKSNRALTRDRREIVTLLSLAAIAIAGGQTGLYYFHEDSPRQQIPRIQKDLLGIKGELEVLKNSAYSSSRAIEDMKKQIVTLGEQLLDMQQLQHEVAMTSIDSVWSGSQAGIRMKAQSDQAIKLANGITTGQLPYQEMADFFGLPGLGTMSHDDVKLMSVKILPKNLIAFKFAIRISDFDATILKADPFVAWSNVGTSEETLNVYQGPTFALHNATSNCTTAIPEPKQYAVFENCSIANFTDPKFSTGWVAKSFDRKTRAQVYPPVVKKTSLASFIQCYEYNITISGRDEVCPPWPIEIDPAREFQVYGHQHKVQLITMSSEASHARIQQIQPNDSFIESTKLRTTLEYIRATGNLTEQLEQAYSKFNGSIVLDLQDPKVYGIGSSVVCFVFFIVICAFCVGKSGVGAAQSSNVSPSTHVEYTTIIQQPSQSQVYPPHVPPKPRKLAIGLAKHRDYATIEELRE